jgi:hypothetical protein
MKQLRKRDFSCRGNQEIAGEMNSLTVLQRAKDCASEGARLFGLAYHITGVEWDAGLVQAIHGLRIKALRSSVSRRQNLDACLGKV